MTIAGGAKLDAADFAAVYPLYVKKSAAETLTSNTTLQDDNDLSIAIAAGQIVRVELLLAVSGPASPGDVKVAWSAGGTLTSPTGRHCIGPDTSITSIASTTVRASATHGLTTAVTYGTDGSGPSAIREDFIIDGGASGGTLTLQWAQNASGTTTTVQANSYMLVTEVKPA